MNADDQKRLATLRAQLARAGHELHIVQKNGVTYFEVRRWGQARTFSTVHDLQGFLNQIGGAA